MQDSFRYKDERNVDQTIHDLKLNIKWAERQVVKLQSFEDNAIPAEAYKDMAGRLTDMREALRSMVRQPAY